MEQWVVGHLAWLDGEHHHCEFSRELEGAAKVEGGGSDREKTHVNVGATINPNGHGHAAQTNGRVAGGVNLCSLSSLLLSVSLLSK